MSSDKTRNVYARERKREKKRERRKFYLTLGRGKIRCRFEGSKQSSRRSLLVTSHNVRCTPTWDIVRITQSFLLELLNLCGKKKSIFLETCTAVILERLIKINSENRICSDNEAIDLII